MQITQDPTTCPFSHAMLRFEKVGDNEPLGVASCLFCGCVFNGRAETDKLGPYGWIEPLSIGLQDDCWVGVREPFRDNVGALSTLIPERHHATGDGSAIIIP